MQGEAKNEKTPTPRRAPASGGRGRSRGGGRGGRGAGGAPTATAAAAGASTSDTALPSSETIKSSKSTKPEKARPHQRKGASSAAAGPRGGVTGAQSGRPARTGALSMRKVLIRNIPHDWDEQRVVPLIEWAGAARHHVWRFVPGRIRSKNRGSRCARMYLDFKKDMELAKSVIDKLHGQAATDNAISTASSADAPTLYVAFAPYQKITREKQRKDTKVGTLDRDPDFIAFMEALAKPKEKLPSADIAVDAKETETTDKQLSALVLYLNTRKRDKKGKFGSKGGDKSRSARVKAAKDGKPAKEKGKGSSKSKAKALESGASRADSAKPRKPRGKAPKEVASTEHSEPGAVRILSSKTRDSPLPTDQASTEQAAAPTSSAKAPKGKGTRRGGPKEGSRDIPLASDGAVKAKTEPREGRGNKSQRAGASGRRGDQPKKIFAPKAPAPAT